MAMAKARRDLDWEGQFENALFPEKARQIRDSRSPQDKKVCTMCGDFCANKGSSNLFGHLLVGSKEIVKRGAGSERRKREARSGKLKAKGKRLKREEGRQGRFFGSLLPHQNGDVAFAGSQHWKT